MTRTRFVRRRVVGATVAIGVVLLAACGSDSSSSTTAAATTAAGAATTAAAAATTAAATTATTAASSAASMPAGSTPAGSMPAGSTPAGSGFAATEDIAALCKDDKPDKLVFTTFAGQKAAMGAGFDGFTAATGVPVEFLENGLADRLTKMAAEKGSPTIDVALVPVNEVPALLDNGIVEPTDTSIPNYDQLLPVAKLDGGYGASILQFGLAYNPQFVTTAPTSWSDLFLPEYSGHIAFPSMPNSGGYATLSMFTQIAGGSEADLTPGVDLVAEHKDDVNVFYPFSTAIEPQVKSGEVWIYPEIGGSALAAAARDVPVEFVVPKEGGPAGLNTLVIPAGGEHSECAKALVSWYLGGEMQTIVAKTLHYGTTSTTPLPADVAASVYPQDLATLVELDWATIAENGPDTLDAWNSKVTG